MCTHSFCNYTELIKHCLGTIYTGHCYFQACDGKGGVSDEEEARFLPSRELGNHISWWGGGEGRQRLKTRDDGFQMVSAGSSLWTLKFPCRMGRSRSYFISSITLWQNWPNPCTFAHFI